MQIFRRFITKICVPISTTFIDIHVNSQEKKTFYFATITPLIYEGFVVYEMMLKDGDESTYNKFENIFSRKKGKHFQNKGRKIGKNIQERFNTHARFGQMHSPI